MPRSQQLTSAARLPVPAPGSSAAQQSPVAPTHSPAGGFTEAKPLPGGGHDLSRMTIYPTESSVDAAPLEREESFEEVLPDVPVASGGGREIPEAVRAKMEASFGADFSDVRVHEGAEAKQVGALAYTRGANIHFQPGRYDPGSASGQALLGHELTHVVQQRAGRVEAPHQDGNGAAPINADAGLEAEADRMGAQAAAQTLTVTEQDAPGA